MQVTIIHGQSHRGSTYHVARLLAQKRNGNLTEKIKAKIDRKTRKLANKIRNSAHVVKPSIKTKAVFGVMRLMQKKGWNKADVDYWKAKGWVEKVRPWKKETAPR